MNTIEYTKKRQIEDQESRQLAYQSHYSTLKSKVIADILATHKARYVDEILSSKLNVHINNWTEANLYALTLVLNILQSNS